MITLYTLFVTYENVLIHSFTTIFPPDESGMSPGSLLFIGFNPLAVVGLIMGVTPTGFGQSQHVSFVVLALESCLPLLVLLWEVSSPVWVALELLSGLVWCV